MARENQAKNWSLIITFSFVVVFGVTALYFHHQMDKLTQTAEKARMNERVFQEEELAHKGRYQEIVERVFDPVSEEQGHEEVVKQTKALIGGPPDIGEQRRERKNRDVNVIDALQFREKALREADLRQNQLTNRNGKLDKKLEDAKERYQSQFDEARKLKEAEIAENEIEIAKYRAFSAELDSKVAEFERKSGDTREALEQVHADMKNDKNSLQKEITDLRFLISRLTQSEQALAQVQYELPDGQILGIVEGGKKAYVDLGLEDGAFVGLLFSVHDKAGGGSPYELPKASVEVLEIVDSHRSLVRVIYSTNTDPPLEGDLLFNPVWSENETGRIAMVGLFELDDESDDRLHGLEKVMHENERFERLIISNGGRIDAKVDLETYEIVGDPGSVTLQTDWLLLGEIPEEKEVVPSIDPEKFQQVKTEIFKQARLNGVRILDYRNFLTFMGYVPMVRRVPEGADYKFLFPKKPTLAEF